MDILGKTVELNVGEVIQMQINPNGYFRRLDIVIKKMALEEILGINTIGIGFYTKMYKKLCVTSNRKIEGRISNLKSLSHKIKTGTFDSKKHPVILTPRKNIWDGSHRIACACYFDHPTIFVRGVSNEFKRGNDFGLNRIKRCFDKQEIEVILESQMDMFDKIGIKIEEEL